MQKTKTEAQKEKLITHVIHVPGVHDIHERMYVMSEMSVTMSMSKLQI